MNSKAKPRRTTLTEPPPNVFLSVFLPMCVIIGAGLPLVIVLLTRH